MLMACADIETVTFAPESPLITCSISPLCLWPTGLYGLTTPYLSEKWVASEGLPPDPDEAILASTTTWSLSIFTSLCLKRGASARIEVMAMHPGEEVRLAPLISSLLSSGTA